MLNSCVMHRNTGPAPGIMVWGGIGYHSRTPLVRIAGFKTASAISPRCWSQLPFLTVRAWPQPYFNRIIARPHVARIVQRFFFNHQIELLPWPACSLILSLIENMWSMVAQRLT
ncbi:transposable element Tcb1 transposase [Trichonephila clavipes]|nr:transposable element Tcb1 transposase [Trichonephila clavipes]